MLRYIIKEEGVALISDLRHKIVVILLTLIARQKFTGANR